MKTDQEKVKKKILKTVDSLLKIMTVMMRSRMNPPQQIYITLLFHGELMYV